MQFQAIGGLGGFGPGRQAQRLPEGLAWYVAKGSDILMTADFHPSGKVEVEDAQIGLYFTDQPPDRPMIPIMIPPKAGRWIGIDIPPGEKDYTLTDAFALPVDVEAIGVGGHQHYIGREIKMMATLPDGSVKPLLYIDDWDIDWQGYYLYKDWIKLPAGTVLDVTLVYDNSADNPQNPNNPPKRIRWGRRSVDEMGATLLLVLPEKKEDLGKLIEGTRNNTVSGFVPVEEDFKPRAKPEFERLSSSTPPVKAAKKKSWLIRAKTKIKKLLKSVSNSRWTEPVYESGRLLYFVSKLKAPG